MSRWDQEEWARRILETMPNAFISVDESGAVAEWNPAAEAMFGWSRSDVFGRPPADMLLPPAAREAFREAIHRVRSDETRVSSRAWEVQALDGRGHTFPVEMMMSRVSMDSTVLVNVFARDVSERNHANEQQAQLAGIVASAHDAMVAVDASGVVTAWNPGAERLLGYAADEVVGQSIGILIPEDRASEEREILRRVMFGESIELLETERVRKDGTRFCASLLASPLRDRDGTIVGASGVLRDMTAAKRAEEETQDARRLLEEFLDHSPGCIYLKDTRGRYLLVNRPFEQVFDVTRGDVVGRTDYDIFPTEIADAFRQNDREVLKVGKPRAIEEQAPHENGTHTPTCR